MARAMWVAFEDLNAVRANEIRVLITESHDLVFAKLTKKAQQELTTAASGRKASPAKVHHRKSRL
jgi:predicted DNA-binding protein (MmcQ/YjbR family)